MRVFWPGRGLARTSGLAVGWRVRDSLCVAAVDDEARSHGVPLSLEVLGHVRSAGHGGEAREPQDDSGIAPLVFWVDSATRIVDCSRPVQVIYYTPPDPERLQFFTLRPMAAPAGEAGDRAREDSDEMGAIVGRLNRARTAQRALAASSSARAEPAPTPDLHAAYSLAAWALLPARAALSALFAGATSNAAVLSVPLGAARHSAAAAQLALRAQQLLDAPAGWRATRAGADVPARSARYMRFWNTAWLVLNDVILGFAARALLAESAGALAAALPRALDACLVRRLAAALAWLDDWPVGLKLNTPLSRALSAALAAAVEAWGARAGPALVAHLPLALRAAAAASSLGLTLTLALAADALALLSLHVRVCAWATGKLAAWQVDNLGALWNLFRGKRWNVLRHRTDSYAYDVDQLFLGTLLFTTSAFLFPTVAVYAALFALVDNTLLAVQAALALAVTALNAFPLCELLLRVKEPSRLPGGSCTPAITTLLWPTSTNWSSTARAQLTKAGIVFVPIAPPTPTAGVPVVAAWELKSFADIFKRV